MTATTKLRTSTDDGLDAQPEGAFTMLSFWLVGNLIYTGQTDRALDYFHEMMARCSNHLGLFAEMFDPAENRQLGDFPQAYSHIGLIHTALNLSGYIVDTAHPTTGPEVGASAPERSSLATTPTRFF